MSVQFNVTLTCDHYDYDGGIGRSCDATAVVPVYSLDVDKVPGKAEPSITYDQIRELGWSQGYRGNHYCPEHTEEK
jgi:hypothetical protein